DLDILKPIIELQGNNEEKLQQLKTVLANSENGLKGIEEIEEVFGYVKTFASENVLDEFVEVDITLARGLNYYTGCIFEEMTNRVAMIYLGGGSSYDDLLDMFVLKGLTGVWFSFGDDRIYDVLE